MVLVSLKPPARVRWGEGPLCWANSGLIPISGGNVLSWERKQMFSGWSDDAMRTYYMKNNRWNNLILNLLFSKYYLQHARAAACASSNIQDLWLKKYPNFMHLLAKYSTWKYFFIRWKLKVKIYANQEKSAPHIQILMRSWFLLCFLHKFLIRGERSI